MKTALITGINGQDGSYLSEHLLNAGYRVYGTVRRHSVSESQDWRLRHLAERVETIYGDLQSSANLADVISRIQPDVIFNLAAQSHVKISFGMPEYTLDINGMGVLRLLEAIRRIVPQARLYQASSSECFGLSVDADGYQRETTPMNPMSPYGCAKVLAYNLVRHYRRAYGMFATNGILFNHTSPRRGSNFVEMKIVRAAVAIHLGRQRTLHLGNLDSLRDIGHSRDYTRAMLMMMEHDKPDDFVVATGTTRTIREICDAVFRCLRLDYADYVVTDEAFRRPEDLPYLCGDASKIRTVLGWTPESSFASTIQEMVSAELERQNNGRNLFSD